MSATDMEISYDNVADVLYVFNKQYNKEITVDISVNADILVRLDESKETVVGLTIESFSRVFPEYKGLSDFHLMEKFETVLGFLNKSHIVHA